MSDVILNAKSEAIFRKKHFNISLMIEHGKINSDDNR